MRNPWQYMKFCGSIKNYMLYIIETVIFIKSIKTDTNHANEYWWNHIYK